MEEKQVIPKVIHYCWFGGKELPDSVTKCIESWKKFCPDFEIKRWDESNFDMTINNYVAEAYQMKKWAFVSDFARIYVLYLYGGIYLDTDVEVIQSWNPLLINEAFMGLESEDAIASGLGMGAIKNHPVLKDIIDIYENHSFILENGELNTVATVQIITDYFVRKGFKMENRLQQISGMVIYPTEFFCPKAFGSNKIKCTKNTYSIHHYDFSWLEETGWKKKLRMKTIPLKLAAYKVFDQFGLEKAYVSMKKKFQR